MNFNALDNVREEVQAWLGYEERQAWVQFAAAIWSGEWYTGRAGDTAQAADVMLEEYRKRFGESGK